MHAFYSFAVWLLQPFVKQKLKYRAMTEPLYGERIEERFGQYRDLDKPSPSRNELRAFRPRIWIHAVSLGESRAAAILLKELRGAIPTMQLLLTSGTATGYAEGEKLLLASDIHIWQPWDTHAATRAFFIHFKPTLGILLETEVWPNLIASASSAGVPVVLANARMSEKTLKKSIQLKWLASPAYRDLTQVYAQTSDDAKRLTKLGATVDGVFGNLKFDVTPSTDQMVAARVMKDKLTKPVMLFASSREGEEIAFLNVLQTLPDAAYSSAHWLIVPRHPQRFEEVADLITAAGFAVVRRSQCSDFSRLATKEIWLGDSLGEMAFYTSLASCALLGGSFEKLGGQNLIEILACGCPVVMGPHTYNFEEAALLAEHAGVAFRANGLASATVRGLALCTTDGFNERLASDFVAKHRGAAAQTAAAIAGLLVAATPTT